MPPRRSTSSPGRDRRARAGALRVCSYAYLQILSLLCDTVVYTVTTFENATELYGIKWRKLVWGESGGSGTGGRGMGGGGGGGEGDEAAPLADPVISSYARCLAGDILCVWRRVPAPQPPADLLDVTPSPPPAPPPLSLRAAKELWIFWYGEEPDLSGLVAPELIASHQQTWHDVLKKSRPIRPFCRANVMSERKGPAETLLPKGRTSSARGRSAPAPGGRLPPALCNIYRCYVQRPVSRKRCKLYRARLVLDSRSTGVYERYEYVIYISNVRRARSVIIVCSGVVNDAMTRSRKESSPAMHKWRRTARTLIVTGSAEPLVTLKRADDESLRRSRASGVGRRVCARAADPVLPSLRYEFTYDFYRGGFPEIDRDIRVLRRRTDRSIYILIVRRGRL
ncbi:Mediator of RNA polymerase II transcription subunit 13 [Eumeta japonica]|uniref:Mediator of RNA polymerase II transcription subunit 13 n=1 Tax=Eumeta variegata TaxID=151549 RepID=A0A4C1TSZ9_EUMVA|nr:Mediator of RNA polymerase II transcription subunit 13 [Eumeta japonica]